MEQTTEQKVAGTILEKGVTVSVGGRDYKVERVSIATLVEVSAVISEIERATGDLPTEEDVKRDPELVSVWAMRSAGAGTLIARAVATLILGAKAIREERPTRRHFFHFGNNHSETRLEQLTAEIAEGMNYEEVYYIFTELLGQSRLAHFFALTTFLRGATLTKPRKVEEETTAFGQ